MLARNSQYGIRVEIVSLNESKLSSIGDVFILPIKLNVTSK